MPLLFCFSQATVEAPATAYTIARVHPSDPYTEYQDLRRSETHLIELGYREQSPARERVVFSVSNCMAQGFERSGSDIGFFLLMVVLAARDRDISRVNL